MDRLSAEGTMRTPSGHRIGYAEFGTPGGRAVMYFHGTPGNRFSSHLEQWGRCFGIRFVAPERPGFGRSALQRGRRLLDWADDMEALADHLGIERFTVMGVSGGGPYALACAYALSPRLDSAICVSGVGPPDAPKELMSEGNKKILADSLTRPRRLAAKLAVGYFIAPRFADKFVDKLPASMPAADRKLRQQPEVRQTFLEALQTVRTRDALGAAYDFRTYASPWGFALSDIATHVDVWQGADDTSVPVSTAEHIAARVPDSRLFVIPNAGHLMVFEHWRQILTEAGFTAADTPATR
jgi:pimeloyl-ACP methyl ester carboxylesterase